MILRLCSAVAGAAVLFAPTANADQYEFVAELDARGVYYSDVLQVMEDGKLTCHYLRRDVGVSETMGDLTEAGYDVHESAILIQSAVKWMCPDQWDDLRAYTEEEVPA